MDVITAELARGLLPPRAPEGHKGTFGHLYVVAGSRGFTGAAKLAAMAGLRSGVGLVTVGIPAPLGDPVAAGLLEAMTQLLPTTREETFSRYAIQPALAFAGDASAVAMGPGLSQHEETQEFAREFTRRCSTPLLLDADGLNALAGHTQALEQRDAETVLTPHPGEMARLTGRTVKDIQNARANTTKALAKESGCVVALKGHETVVADPSGNCLVNSTGNNGLATGGTGDVLSGLVGGLLAQGMSGFDAATLGVYVHGLAGDLAAEAKTQRGMIASDVIDHIPDAWRALEEPA